MQMETGTSPLIPRRVKQLPPTPLFRRPWAGSRITRRAWLCGLTGAVMQNASASNQLVLDIRAAIRNTALEVTYDIANQGQQAMVAFDGATGTGGGEFLDLTTGCYV